MTVTEFGAFVWADGHWVFSTVTGEPFTGDDFAEWYSCPEAKVAPGQRFTDPVNWGGDDVLRPAKTLWYFVGVTAAGKRVKGTAVLEQLPAVERVREAELQAK